MISFFYIFAVCRWFVVVALRVVYPKKFDHLLEAGFNGAAVPVGSGISEVVHVAVPTFE